MAKRKAHRVNRPAKNPAGMLQQLQKIQQQVLEAQEQLAEETVTASAGGGGVKITVTGDQRCTAVEIAPELFQDGDVEILQDMVLAAINAALDSSREMAQSRLGPLTSGLGGLGI